MAVTSKRVPRRRVSLEYKLPLLITGLLLALVVAGSLMAYREVRRSAIQAAAERLERLTPQLAALTRNAVAQRRELLRSVASDTAVVSQLLEPESSGPGLIAALERLKVPADSTPIELVGADRRMIVRIGEYPANWTAEQVAAERGQLPLADSVTFGALRTVNDRAFFWVVAPVRDAGRLLGYLAQLRPVGSPRTGRQVQALLNDSAPIYYADLHGGPWVGLDGRVEPAPAPPVASLTSYHRPGVGVVLANGEAIRGTALGIVVESPMSVVLARPAGFVRDLFLGAFILMLAGAAGAWLLSRRITRPLKELGSAARDIAGGDYSRRISFARGDEIGSLAKAFSFMAAEVESAHAALQRQYEEARRLASRLESTNDQLVLAMEVAEVARAEAETASRAKSEFLATMSHEIRTPINAIVGYTDLLQMGIPDSVTDAQSAQLERIRASGQVLIGLVDEVLDLASIESGRLSVEVATGRIGDAVGAALSVVAPEAERKGVRLSEECQGEADTPYRGDHRRVEQILINLLTNALKFTRPGGRVSVRAAVADECWAAVAVEDTGIGIPADRLDDIFKPFVQADQSYTRSHGGVGLGLAISWRLARTMDGEITVASKTGVGSTFTLRLPLAARRNGGAGPARW